jgi:hypothetical protein
MAVKTLTMDFEDELILIVRHYDIGASGHKFHYRSQTYRILPFEGKAEAETEMVLLPKFLSQKDKLK